MRIAVTGGTGFVGGHLAVALAQSGHQVVVVARGHDTRSWAREVQQHSGVEVALASVADTNALVAAFAGCDAVAHCAGINRETGPQTYQAVHVDGTSAVVRAAEQAGVKRLVLASFLRARPDGGSAYHESKWMAEEIVRQSSLDWTVLKLGITIGGGDHVLTHLTRALLTSPIYVGMGRRRIRPVAVEDVVRILIAALVDERLVRQTVAVLGPTELYLDEIARTVARAIGKRRTFITAPLLFHRLLARVAERTMQEPLLSRAQVRMLAEELVEPVGALDPLPDDLRPTTTFEAAVARAQVRTLRRYGWSDFVRPSRHDGGSIPHVPRVVRVCAEGRAVIDREPEAIFAFVLDVEQYRKADHKIGRLHYLHREGTHGEVRHGGRILGLPAPAATLAFELTPQSRLDFQGVSMPWPLKGFDGFFTCEPSPRGLVVTHRECFIFGTVTGHVFRTLLGGWFARDTQAEVLRMKRLLEAATRAPGEGQQS